MKKIYGLRKFVSAWGLTVILTFLFIFMDKMTLTGYTQMILMIWALFFGANFGSKFAPNGGKNSEKN